MKILEFRAAIDIIDDQIIDLLNQRSQIVKNVGELKKENHADSAFVRSGREAEIIRKIYKKFSHKDAVFPALAATSIWRMIICASLSLESKFNVSFCGGNDIAILASEYFGGFTDIIRADSIDNMLTEVESLKSQVGVISIEDLCSIDLANDLKIFACLPFVLQKDKNIKAFAFAKTKPEASSDDRYIYQLISDNLLNNKDLQELLGCNGEILACSKQQTKNTYIISCEKENIEPNLNIKYLGTYATPITIV